ncbi:MAG: cellulose synthase subunit BcsC-related outer membrane protein, partial [Alphaproteobacteria bacterium]
GGPLGSKVNARYAAAAFSGGDYLTARAYAPDAYNALEGVDHPWYRQAVAVRSQSGTSGENRLSGAVATTSAGRTRGADRMEAGLSVYTLDPGSSASPGRPVARETFALPYAAWSREGRSSLAARIGLLPLGADAGTAVTGELAVSTKADAGAFEARAYSRPRADSVLSFAGQKDAGGAAYGRVAETG